MSKKLKAIAYTIVMLAFLTVAVLGTWFSDIAKTPFWWNFWIVADVISVGMFIYGVHWLSKNKKKW